MNGGRIITTEYAGSSFKLSRMLMTAVLAHTIFVVRSESIWWTLFLLIINDEVPMANIAAPTNRAVNVPVSLIPSR